MKRLGLKARVPCLAGTLMALLLLGNACAQATSVTKPVVHDCVLPNDQVGTLSGRWKVTAVPVALHDGDWPDAAEVADLVAAMDTWNTFYAASLGMAALDYGGDKSNPRTSKAPKPAALCGQGILQGNQFTGQVVIYKDGRWPYPSLQQAIALTSFCPTPATPLPSFYMAIMEVNYQNFFVDGTKVPDLQTIVLHEFGHLMGLNHSCENVSNKNGTPDCRAAALNPDYHEALMFPVFGFDETGAGEQKRSLTSNDQGRANCLYKDLVAAGTGGH